MSTAYAHFTAGSAHARVGRIRHAGRSSADDRLLPLEGADATRERVADAFADMVNRAHWKATSLTELSAKNTPGIVYLFGHAWLSDEVFTIAANATCEMRACEVFSTCSRTSPDRYCSSSIRAMPRLCDLNCENGAAALDRAVRERCRRIGVRVFRQWIANVPCSAACTRRLRKREVLDSLDLYIEAGRQLSRTEVVAAQAVGYGLMARRSRCRRSPRRIRAACLSLTFGPEHCSRCRQFACYCGDQRRFVLLWTRAGRDSGPARAGQNERRRGDYGASS